MAISAVACGAAATKPALPSPAPQVKKATAPPVSTAPGTPAATLLAFGRAFEKHDFKAAAALVVGGRTGYDFKRVIRDITDFNLKVVRFKIVGVRTAGDSATVTFSAQYDGAYIEKDQAHLSRTNGQWKIVPDGSDSWLVNGTDFHTFVKELARPEDILDPIAKGNEKTRNHMPEAIRLGKERASFLGKVLSKDGDNGGSFYPYHGYSTSMMDQYTDILFPAGRADELIFIILTPGQTVGGYVTRWKTVNGKPKRLWQVDITGKGRKIPKSGTLAALLGTNLVPEKSPKDLIDVMGKRRGYASYSMVIATDEYVYGFVTANYKPQPETESASTSEPPEGQSSSQAGMEGFYVTPEEVTFLGKSK